MEWDCYYGELSKQNALTVSVSVDVVGTNDICVFHPSPGGEIIGPFWPTIVSGPTKPLMRYPPFITKSPAWHGAVTSIRESVELPDLVTR